MFRSDQKGLWQLQSLACSGSITEANVTCWWSVWTPTGALQEAIEDDPWGQRELDPWGWTRSWERPQYSSTECGSEGTFWYILFVGGKVGLRLTIQIGMALAIVGLVEVMKKQKVKEKKIYIVLVFIKCPWREQRKDMPCSASQQPASKSEILRDFLPLQKVASWFTPASGDSLYVGRRSQRWSCIGCRRFGCGHCQWLATALRRCSVSTETLIMLLDSMKGDCIICIAWFMILFRGVDVYAFVSYQCR